MMYFLMLRIFRFSLLSPAGTLSSSSSFSRFIYFLSGCNLAFFLPFFLPILYPFFLRPPEKERAQIYWRLSLREEEEEEEERAPDPCTEKETKTGRQCHISALVPLFPLLLVFLATDQVSPVQLVALGSKVSMFASAWTQSRNAPWKKSLGFLLFFLRRIWDHLESAAAAAQVPNRPTKPFALSRRRKEEKSLF